MHRHRFEFDDKRSRAGFSLAEVLVVAAIAVVVVIAVGNFGSSLDSLGSLVTVQLQSASDVNQSLQIMAGEIKSAESSANGAFAVESAGTSSFVFYGDVYRTGIPDRVRYFFSGSTLYKGVTAPTGTPATYPSSSEIVTDFIDHVYLVPSSSLFSYYASGYTGTQAPLAAPAVPTQVALVRIAFEVMANASSNAVPPQPFSLLVGLRNLEQN